MKIRSVILFFLFGIFSISISANENIILSKDEIEFDPTILNSSSADFLLLNSSSLRLGFGLTSFHGDIMEKETLSSAYSIHLEVPTKSLKHLLQIGLIKGGVSGKDLSSNYTLASEPSVYLKNGEGFEMQFIELDINYVINLSSIFDKKIKEKSPEWNRLEFLCKIGFGLNMFRALRQEIQTENFINSYGYEWDWQNNFENAGNLEVENVTEGVLLFGVTSKYDVSEKLGIDFSVTGRYGNTDKWDAKVQNNNDMFMFYSLGTIFKISKN